MASYVHPDNQQLLWNVLQKTPLVQQFFSNYDVAFKEKWFKSVIQMFYEKNKHMPMDIQMLNQLNRETLSYMLSSIQDRAQPPVQPQSQYNITNVPLPAQPEIISRENTHNARQEILNSQLTQRQKEYDSMMQRPTQSEIDFREKELDAAIPNMEELVQHHIKQREEELRQYQPTALAQAPTPVQAEPVREPKNHPLVIENPAFQNIQFEVEELPISSQQKKNVSWASDAPVIHDSIHTIMNVSDDIMERMNMQHQEINTLRTVVFELTKDIQVLKQELANVVSKISG
jgi:hypothetical protein